MQGATSTYLLMCIATPHTHAAGAGAEQQLIDWIAAGGGITPASPRPDYTDDEISDDEQDDGYAAVTGAAEAAADAQRSAAARSRPPAPPAAFDPCLQSPVFFGYTRVTASELRAQHSSDAAARAAGEHAMMQRQQQRIRSRAAALSADAQRKREARVKKAEETAAGACVCACLL